MPLRVTGLPRIRRSLNRLPAAMAYEMYGPMSKVVIEEIVKKAKASRAFRDRTGQLRRSIRAERLNTTRNIGGNRRIRVNGGAWRVAANFPALFVEFGHGGPAPAPPHPFLRPAIVGTQRKQFEVAYREGLAKFPRALGRARSGG